MICTPSTYLNPNLAIDHLCLKHIFEPKYCNGSAVLLSTYLNQYLAKAPLDFKYIFEPNPRNRSYVLQVHI